VQWGWKMIGKLQDLATVRSRSAKYRSNQHVGHSTYFATVRKKHSKTSSAKALRDLTLLARTEIALGHWLHNGNDLEVLSCLVSSDFLNAERHV